MLYIYIKVNLFTIKIYFYKLYRMSFFDTQRLVKTHSKILKHSTKVQDHKNKTISKIIINLPISLLNFIVCFYSSLCVTTLISSYIFRTKINIPSSVSFKLTVRNELHQRIASHFKALRNVNKNSSCLHSL
jgi:hypothetical protein